MKGKRILICCNRSLCLGGIEKALTTFLNEFNTADNEVLLVLHDENGVLHNDLPLEQINVFYTNSIDASTMLRDDLKHFRFLECFKGLWNRLMLRLDKDWYARIMYTYRILSRKLVFPGHFDCAISFSTDYSDLSMILRADADNRIAFVHGDATQHPRAARLNDSLLHKLDKIYCVSERAKELFLSVHPTCNKTADVMHNVIPVQKIRELAKHLTEDMISDGTPTLCTVGRLSPEKGQLMIPKIGELLREKGHAFRWYLVGDGSLRNNLEKEIIEKNLQPQIILLGGKANPYPYIKNCDIYVQTSYSEAYCITVAEARILNKPIATTDAPGIREQIGHNKTGLIASEMTPKALYDCIEPLLISTDLRAQFSKNLELQADTDFSEMESLYQFIES